MYIPFFSAGLFQNTSAVFLHINYKWKILPKNNTIMMLNHVLVLCYVLHEKMYSDIQVMSIALLNSKCMYMN